MNTRMIRRALLVAGIAVLATASYGNPERYIADLVWTDDAAPWEKVTAVYIPDTDRPGDILISEPEFENLAACRAHVDRLAAEHGDPDLEKGRYDCAIGFYLADDDGTSGSYRLIRQ